jgi:DNA-binding LacI/PurR family transcriptional regulator
MPGSKAPSVTIDVVAKRANVSVATISRVLNKPAIVAPETIARVRAAIAELKYVPHTAARNLATKKTNTIGLLMADIGGDFFAPLLSGIEAAAREAGFDLLISASVQPAPHGEFPRSLGAHNTDGLLVFADSVGEAGLAQRYEQGLPTVLIHQSPPNSMDIPCVTVENKAASRKIVEHLIEVHGRRRIAFLNGPEGQEDSYWREMGYREALQAHDIPFDPRLVAPGEFDRNVAATSVKSLLGAGVETPALACSASVDAIFSGDDEAAVGVLEALQTAGKRVPEDVAVVGFDDQRLSAYLVPPLTTVRAPTERVGYAAAQQLVSLIRTGQAERLTLLPTEMIIRRSCGCG